MISRDGTYLREHCAQHILQHREAGRVKEVLRLTDRPQQAAFDIKQRAPVNVRIDHFI